MKTTHVRVTKYAKQVLKEMAKQEKKTAAQKLEEIIQDTYARNKKTR